MSKQLLRGTLLHFLYVGVCHGMASEDTGLVAFLKTWEQGFLNLLEAVPLHFERVMLNQRPLKDDPWPRRFIGDRDPEFDPESEGIPVG